MAVQKSRKSRAKRNSRRNSHSALQNPSLSIDQTTGSTHRRHHLSADGYYKGKQVVVVNEVVDEE